MKKKIVMLFILFLVTILGLILSLEYKPSWSTFFIIYSGVCLGAIVGFYHKNKGFSLNKKKFYRLLIVASVVIIISLLVFSYMDKFRFLCLLIVNLAGWFYSTLMIYQSININKGTEMN